MSKVLLSLILFGVPTVCWSAAPMMTVNYSGILVAEPCVIPPGEESLELDFGLVIDKYLYLNQRTPGKVFFLKLTECDISLGETVSISFGGTESAALPGLLAINSKTVSGIAIGLESASGELLPLNQLSKKLRLKPGSNIITLNAYIRGEPEAIKNKKIGRGQFSALTTFQLSYE